MSQLYAEDNSLEQLHTEKASRSSHSSQQTQQQPPRCANCDIDILWPPTVVQGKTYCCTGCAAGGPCSCDYSEYRSVTIFGVIHYRYPD